MADDLAQTEISVKTELGRSAHDTLVIALQSIGYHHDWHDPV